MAALHGFAYSAPALATLKTLQKKLRTQIVGKINSLAANPHPPGCKQVKGMKDGEEQVWRIRSGDYRVLYVVRDVTVAIIDIDHRKDVYR